MTSSGSNGCNINDRVRTYIHTQLEKRTRLDDRFYVTSVAVVVVVVIVVILAVIIVIEHHLPAQIWGYKIHLLQNLNSAFYTTSRYRAVSLL